MTSSFRLLSLFSGIGSFELALSRAGIVHDVVAFSEIDDVAVGAYTALHGVPGKLNLGDISSVRVSEVPDADLVTYGFPCQDVSIIGKMDGISPDTRSGLLEHALRIIDAKRPAYAIAENVKNLTSKRFSQDFNSMLDTLNAYGYVSMYRVLNALDYGVPQKRERVFIVSIRKDVFTSGYTMRPKWGYSRKSLSDLLDADAVEPVLSNIYGGFSETKPRIFYGYAPTIRTARGGGHIPSVCTTDASKVERVVHGHKIRTLSPRECFRLMAFSDEDIDKVPVASNTALYRLAGNSIVVNVAQAILEELLLR